MKIFESVTVILWIVAIVLRHSPSDTYKIISHALIYMVSFLLPLFYLLIGPFYLNNIAAKDLFKRSVYAQISPLRLFGTNLTCVASAFFVLALNSTFLFYCGYLIVTLAALLALIILVTTLIRYFKKKDDFYGGIAIRMAVCLAIDIMVLSRFFAVFSNLG